MTLWEIIDSVKKIKADYESGDYVSALGDLADFITACQAKVGFPLPTSGLKPGKAGGKGRPVESEEATVETLMAVIDSIEGGTPKRGRKKAGSGTGGFQNWAGFIVETLRNFVNTWIETHPPDSPSPEPGGTHDGEETADKTTEES